MLETREKMVIKLRGYTSKVTNVHDVAANSPRLQHLVQT